MNSIIIQNVLRFIGLLLVQVLILDQINLFGYLNPMVYIVYVYLFPLRKNKTLLLVSSFLLGLSIDYFSNTGGVNAAATLFIAFFRLPILKAILRKSDFDYVLFNLRSIAFNKLFMYIVILTFVHHFIVFSLEYFSFKQYLTLLTSTLFSTMFTVVISILGIFLFTRRR